MTRTQFLGLFTIPFLPKTDLEQERHVFNVKILKERIAFLRKKYPLTENEAFKKACDDNHILWMRYKQNLKNGND